MAVSDFIFALVQGGDTLISIGHWNNKLWQQRMQVAAKEV